MNTDTSCIAVNSNHCTLCAHLHRSIGVVVLVDGSVVLFAPCWPTVQAVQGPASVVVQCTISVTSNKQAARLGSQTADQKWIKCSHIPVLTAGCPPAAVNRCTEHLTAGQIIFLLIILWRPRRPVKLGEKEAIETVYNCLPSGYCSLPAVGPDIAGQVAPHQGKY